ncbi:MAG: carbohydrate kinase family protein, partial [Phycisphaerales bacterium]|nr:carbohydrate kinase family protein [Phycisphaerales bacterium]
MPIVSFVGTASLDVIVSGLEDVPQQGGTALAERARIFPGGNALNASLAAAQLGLNGFEIRLIAPWGTRWVGRILSEYTNKLGIEAPLADKYRDQRGMHTSISVVLSDAGTDPRSLCALHSLSEFTVQDLETTLPSLVSSDWIHFGGLGLLPGIEKPEIAKLLRKVRKKRPDVVMSGDVTLLYSRDLPNDETAELTRVSTEWRERIGPMLEFFDYLFLNEDELHQLAGPSFVNDTHSAVKELQARWLGQQARAVVVKQGLHGATVYERGHRPVVVDPKKGVKVTDSTGAGDCWCAGFIMDHLHRGGDELT